MVASSSAALFRALRQLDDYKVRDLIENGANVQVRNSRGQSLLVALAYAKSADELDMSDDVALDARMGCERALLQAGAPVLKEVVDADDKHGSLLSYAFFQCFLQVLDDDEATQSKMLEQLDRFEMWLTAPQVGTPAKWGVEILPKWSEEMLTHKDDGDFYPLALEFGRQALHLMVRQGLSAKKISQLYPDTPWRDEAIQYADSFVREKRAQTLETKSTLLHATRHRRIRV